MKWILVLLCAALATGGNMVAAQSFPSKPIHVIVNFTLGGPTDLVARMLAPRMTLDFGQSVIVDNRPSANGVLGSEQAARSAPDGHTLLFSTSSHTSLLAALYGNKVTFDPFRDIAPISLLVVSSQMIVAHPSLGVKTIGDMVKLAKAKPNVLNFGTGGAGTANHLGIELIKVMAGVDIVHVPYKGIAQATSDLLGGRVQLMLSSMASVLPYVKSGKLVALAVGGAQRSPAAPDIPTVAESGYPGYEVATWFAMFAPAATPREVIARLNTVCRQALDDPQNAKALAAQGAEPSGGTPEQLARMMRDEYERWKKVIIAAKIEVD